jgi:hypothetical protein
MQKQILSELKELRNVLSKIVGTSDIPNEAQFSTTALDKAASEFKKMQIARGEWVPENEIYKFIKHAGWRAGKFIRTEFYFSNYFKQGHSYYYNKKDLVKLSKELKDRNVNLGRYIEFKISEIEFRKKVAEATKNNKSNHKRRAYQIPNELNNITTSEPPLPSVDLVKGDIKSLEEQFFRFDLSQYIDIYHGSYAMMKNDYVFLKYRDKALGAKCRKWCDNFNYANIALEALTKKRSNFVPVKEENMIEL